MREVFPSSLKTISGRGRPARRSDKGPHREPTAAKPQNKTHTSDHGVSG